MVVKVVGTGHTQPVFN